jgi:hypothetical protein
LGRRSSHTQVVEIMGMPSADQRDDSRAELVSELAIAPTQQRYVLLPAVRAGDVLIVDVEKRPGGEASPLTAPP